uniref:Uncharacterized protein n=1 Tax=Arundo donax TaxID=35708 RepID=A0A0A9ANG8_ARUDO
MLCSVIRVLTYLLYAISVSLKRLVLLIYKWLPAKLYAKTNVTLNVPKYA